MNYLITWYIVMVVMLSFLAITIVYKSNTQHNTIFIVNNTICKEKYESYGRLEFSLCADGVIYINPKSYKIITIDSD